MNYFSLFPSTFITKGNSQSCLVDVEKSRYCIVPNSMHVIFESQTTILINELMHKYENENEIIVEYLDFLSKNNFGIYHNNTFSFIQIDQAFFDKPFSLVSLIIDAISEIDLMFKLDCIGFGISIMFMQFRLFFEPSIDFLVSLNKRLVNENRVNVELLVNKMNTISIAEFRVLLNENSHIYSRIVIFNSNINKTHKGTKLIEVKTKLLNKSQCGIISEKLFISNIHMLQMTHSCNSCLFKKMAIGITGDIKNCPSAQISFGNIFDLNNVSNISNIIKSTNFRKLWYIKKDEIAVCKDCEYRTICTDCRAFTEDPNDIYSKPLKCGYSPYTNKWEKWSTNPLKSAAIKYYELDNI